MRGGRCIIDGLIGAALVGKVSFLATKVLQRYGITIYRKVY